MAFLLFVEMLKSLYWGPLFIFTLQVNSLNRGSCEGCEAACGVVFRPVCSRDQDTVYPNQCQAACAGAADTVECQVHCRN